MQSFFIGDNSAGAMEVLLGLQGGGRARSVWQSARFGEEPARSGGQPARFVEEPARSGGQPARFGEEPARSGGQLDKVHIIV